MSGSSNAPVEREITVLGGINMDLVMHLDRLPVPGESRRAQGFGSFPGGKGANQAAACAKLGVRTTFISALGEDGFGISLRGQMESFGVDMRFVPVKQQAPTGTAMIMVGGNGQNLIAFSPGAAAKLSVDEIAHAIKAASPGSLFLTQAELGCDLVFQALKLAKEHGLTVIWNPAPAPQVEVPADVIRAVDFVIPNESEVTALTGRSTESIDEAENALRALRDQGYAHPVITLGERGSIVLDGDRVRVIPALRVDSVDATAAGDVFVGAFSTQLAAGLNTLQCLEFATRAAALSTTRLGAMTSIPERAEVEAMNAAIQQEREGDVT